MPDTRADHHRLPCARFVAACLLLATFAAPTHAFQLVPQAELIDADIAAVPIDVVLWIRDTVSDDDAAWITAEIEAGLELWEAVETSALSFAPRVVRSASRPTVGSASLLIVIANRADLSTGGTIPSRGTPGEWRGAIADFRDVCTAPCNPFRIIAAHEIGHAVGILHSTVSSRAFTDGVPMMHFSASHDGLTADDVAAISTAYPNPARPLTSVTGTVRGRCVHGGTGRGIDGINVVAVDVATGTPRIGHLTGTGDYEGTFVLTGLPPATYALHVLDGSSFGGAFFGLPPSLVQLDNFDAFTLGPVTVAAGETVDVGAVPVAIAPLQLAPTASAPPVGTAGVAYDTHLALHGGVRPLRYRGAEHLPAGLSGSIGSVLPSYAHASRQAELRVRGLPATVGAFPTDIRVADGHGTETLVPLDLQIVDTVVNPICDDGAHIEDAVVVVKGLDKDPGRQSLTITGRVRLDPAMAATIDPTRDGLQIRLDDVAQDGDTVFALTRTEGGSVPGDALTCGTRDGWRARGTSFSYKNRSGALDAPACTTGSANGLTQVQVRGRRTKPGELRIKIKTRDTTLTASPEGPIRVTIVFGTDATAGADGRCASTHAFAAPPCSHRSRGRSLRCR